MIKVIYLLPKAKENLQMSSVWVFIFFFFYFLTKKSFFNLINLMCNIVHI